MPKINFTVAVWGEEYTETFLDHIVPSFLSPGNFPYVRKHIEQLEFFIYIGRSVEHLLRGHQAFQRLAQTVPTKVILIDDLDPAYLQRSVYENLNLCHRHFIHQSNQEGAAMAFLCPDTLCSDGSFKELVLQSKAGKRAILAVGMRTDREAVLGVLDALPLETRLQGHSAKSLMKLVVKYPHRITKSLVWSSKFFDRGWPSNLLWQIGDQGFLCRAFHIHTFYVHPRSPEMPGINHDFDWLSKLDFSEDDVHLVQDSDQICFLELSPKKRAVITKNQGRSSIVRVAVWVYRHTMADHRKYFRKPIYFHLGATNSWKWKLAELQSWITCQAVLFTVNWIPTLLSVRKRIQSIRIKREGDSKNPVNSQL